ncbi:hypothetical protein Tco_0211228 [Tanacetum coccineum]
MLQIFSQRILMLADETVYKEWEDRMERAATTASSLEAEHDSGNINRTQSMATLNESFPQGTGSGSGPRSDLKLDDVEGTLSTHCYHFCRIGKNWNLDGGVKFLMYSRFVHVFLDKQVEGMSKHKGVYVTPSHTKKVFANMKRPCKGFSGRVTPLFSTMMVQATEDMGEDSATLSDSYSTPIISQPSSSKPQKKKSRRKQRKDSGAAEHVTYEAPVSTPSYDPPKRGADSMQLSELMNLYSSKLERKEVKTPGLKRLRKIGSTSRVESSNDVSLGDQEDAFKQRRKIVDLDVNAEVTLVDETQEMNDDNLMFDIGVLEEQEKEVGEKEVSAADPVTTAGEVVTTASVEVTTANAPTTTIDELTLAQTLIKIKAAKPKAATSAVTTTTTTRPKARGAVVQELSEFKTTSSPLQASQLPQAKDKGKAKMVEPEKPLKKKDQIAMDKEVARNIEAQLQAEKKRVFQD